MGKILRATTLVEGVAYPADQPRERRRSTDTLGGIEDVDTRQPLEPQPLPDQRSAPLGRLGSFARRLPGRAHRIVRVVVVAGTVAIAVNGRAIASPDPLVDLAIEFAAEGDFIDFQQRIG
ncbi:hypothetical protein FQZ97_648540 [compost metagenome]